MGVHDGVVYQWRDFDTMECFYVGSTVNPEERERQHRNHKFPHHGPFGRWAHKEKMFPRMEFQVLEFVEHEDREQLKKECRRIEFLWKQEITPSFGQNDGLQFQPIEVRKQIRREQIKRCQQKPEQKKKQRIREAIKRAKWTPEERDERNKQNRGWHAKRRLKNDGVVVVPRPRGLSKDERLKRKREQYRLKQLALGRTIRTRGRVHKPKRTRGAEITDSKNVQPAETAISTNATNSDAT